MHHTMYIKSHISYSSECGHSILCVFVLKTTTNGHTVLVGMLRGIYS